MEMNEIIELLRKDRDSDKIPWIYICRYKILSEEFIIEFSDKVNWWAISRSQKLSESFIKEFKDKVNWWNISVYQKLSEEFIREFSDKVYWSYISEYRKLSEEFIKEFKDKVDWWNISKYQKLSESFIREYSDKVNLDWILDYNWLYKSEEYKKDQLTNTNVYECYDDYFIAYKAIRSDNYSLYNFQYKYEIGNTYECHADHTSKQDSFGLSVWTKEEAIEYGSYGTELSYKIIKVKVYYKDIARIVHDNNKIRCTKLEVLSIEE